MNIEFLRNNYRNQILEIAEVCNVENVRVFGSVARGDAGSNSDVDFLVHIRPNTGIEFFGMKADLEKLLNIKIDVVTDTTLHPRIRERILNEAIAL